MRVMTLSNVKLLADLMTELESLKTTNLKDYILNRYESSQYPNQYILSMQWDESYFPPVTDELEFTIEPDDTITTIEAIPEHFSTVAKFMQYILS